MKFSTGSDEVYKPTSLRAFWHDGLDSQPTVKVRMRETETYLYIFLRPRPWNKLSSKGFSVFPKPAEQE